MLTHMQADRPWTSLHDRQQEDEVSHGTRGFHQERNWCQLESSAGAAAGDIEISRWTDLQNTSRHEEATTPPDRYFIGIAFKVTCLTLTKGRQTIFEGIMPAGTL
jgi:AraC family transcriptional regulator